MVMADLSSAALFHAFTHLLLEAITRVANEGGEHIVLVHDEPFSKVINELNMGHYSDVKFDIVRTQVLVNHNNIQRSMLQTNRKYYKNFVALVSSENVAKVLDEAQQLEIIGPFHSWVIITSTLDVDGLVNNSYIRTDDNIVLLNISTSKAVNGNISVLVNSWDKNAFIDEQPIYKGTRLLYDKDSLIVDFMNKPFKGFYGHTFHVSVNPNKIFQYTLPSGGYAGLAFDILNELAITLNFSYKIIEPPDDKWGSLDDDGEWNGMIGMILRKEVDFAIGSFTVTLQRSSAVDFTVPFWQGSIAMVMDVDVSGNSLWVYLNPFQWHVWVALCTSIPAFGLLLWFLTTMADLTIYGSGDNPTLLNCILVSIRCSCLQSGEFLGCDRSAQGKYMLTFIWLFFLVISSTYIGNLMASLAVPRIDPPVDTLAELINQNEYAVGLISGRALITVLQDSAKGSTYQNIWQLISEDNIMNSLDEGFQRVQSEPFIFLDDTKNLIALVSELGDCSLYIAKEKFLYSGYAFPLPKGSPMVEIFDKGILRMIDVGLIEKWMKQHWPRALSCGSSQEPQPMKLIDTKGAFYFLSIGLLMSGVVLLIENILHSHHKRKLLKINRKKIHNQ